MIKPRDYDPPTVAVPHPAPPAADPLPTAELDAVACGLDPEQEIRIEALRAAAALLQYAEPQMTSRFVAGYADVLADWIRTGTRP